MRYSVLLSYNGAAFRGWQRQADAPSVQEELERAISTLTGVQTGVTGAGRTDTAVNAIGYVASFEAREGLDTPDFCYKLNAILPSGICVHGVRREAADFNARFDARRREYCYFLHRSKDPFIDRYSYLYGYPELDFDFMNRVAEKLLGTHDFSCFEKSGSDNKTSVCTVFEAGWHRYTPTHVAIMGLEPLRLEQLLTSATATHGARSKNFVRSSPDSSYWYFRIAADRFLRNMVRAVVGTLLEVGRGKRSSEDFAGLILPPEPLSGAAPGTSRPVRRSLAGESVPGHALFLSRIEY
ncbi:MAG: tRNA pseudouridine synthase A [Bacteroidales bacterium]|nr:tRNA pseudouridine synthase A [Bacteroidales bacterium]